MKVFWFNPPQSPARLVGNGRMNRWERKWMVRSALLCATPYPTTAKSQEKILLGWASPDTVFPNDFVTWPCPEMKQSKQKPRLVRAEGKRFFKATAVGSTREKVTPQWKCGWSFDWGNDEGTKVWGEHVHWQRVGWPYAVVSQHSCDLGEGPALAQGGLQAPKDLFQLCAFLRP